MLLEEFFITQSQPPFWIIGKEPVKHVIFTEGQRVCPFSYRVNLSPVENLQRNQRTLFLSLLGLTTTTLGRELPCSSLLASLDQLALQSQSVFQVESQCPGLPLGCPAISRRRVSTTSTPSLSFLFSSNSYQPFICQLLTPPSTSPIIYSYSHLFSQPKDMTAKQDKQFYLAFCVGSIGGHKRQTKQYLECMHCKIKQRNMKQRRRKEEMEKGKEVWTGREERRKKRYYKSCNLIFQNSSELIIRAKCRILLGFLIHILRFNTIFMLNYTSKGGVSVLTVPTPQIIKRNATQVAVGRLGRYDVDH